MLRRVVLSVLCAALVAGCSTATAAVARTPGAAAVPASWASLLGSRAHAVLTRDAAALRRSEAPSATESVRDLGLRTAALPLVRWSYAVDSTSSGSRPGERVVLATLHYRLGADVSDSAGRRRLVLRDVAGSGGWLLVSDDPVGVALPWDVGATTYARAGHGTALSTTGQPPAELAAAADRAEAAVTRVWGTGWSRSPVAVGVAGATDLARLTGRTVAEVAGLAAVSTADRVYVDLAAYARLSAAGRQVLVTHEVTHLATDAAGDAAVPLWLKEGFADYVGFLGSGIGTATAAATLLDRVRRSGPPATLPADAAFDPSSAAADRAGYTVADAYSAAWLACSLIAAQAGPGGLGRVYRATSGGGADPASNVDAALREVTGRPLHWWTQRWRTELADLAGTAGAAGAVR